MKFTQQKLTYFTTQFLIVFLHNSFNYFTLIFGI